MRPTPSAAIDGIVSILRDTVAPAVTDPHARTQLHQVIGVLGQLRTDDPAADLAAASAGTQELLARCSSWIAADPKRADAFAALAATAAPDPTYASQDRAHRANRAALETFLVELRAWRKAHGPDDSQELVDAIGDHLARPPAARSG